LKEIENPVSCESHIYKELDQHHK